MSAIMELNQQTLFTINALWLVVFAIAFAFAGLERRDRYYWLYMVTSNIIFAVAFFIFSKEIGGSTADVFFPNLLLFVGLCFRWIAIREFFHHSTSLVKMTLLPLAAIFTFISWPLLGNSTVFGIINLLISIQILAIIWSIATEREVLKSKWGLIASYAVLIISSFLRALQGWFFEPSMESLLPADIFLQLNLIAAAIHIGASGAFSLLIAYERSMNNLREIALRDPLTGLLNRWSIETVANPGAGKTYSGLVSVIMIDIDYFKRINDTYGHAVGDAALKHCAELIKDTFSNDNLLARVGGEEFMILAPGQSSISSEQQCKELRKKLAEDPFRHRGRAVPFTISIGICSGHVNTRAEFDVIWNSADKALYDAKSSGRDVTRIAEPAAELSCKDQPSECIPKNVKRFSDEDAG
ncbi:GGDEF domain-containing protein [Brucella sp. TWI432]